jgi:hypothetical protein
LTTRGTLHDDDRPLTVVVLAMTAAVVWAAMLPAAAYAAALADRPAAQLFAFAV